VIVHNEPGTSVALHPGTGSSLAAFIYRSPKSARADNATAPSNPDSTFTVKAPAFDTRCRLAHPAATRPRNAAEAPSMISMRDVDAGERPELPVVVPTIPASAGALVRGRKGRLLILKPTYKAGWTVPGGVIEIGESPWEACRRETKEECGLDVTAGRLVCLDFLRPRPGRPGGMRFLFDCGVFDDAVLDMVVIQPAEIAESRVLPLEAALPLLSGPVRRRVRAACESKQVRYLEDGLPVEGIRS
jgi:8-oxo-dGTP diphosphatase